MSSRARGDARGLTTRALVVASVLALFAAVGIAVGGAGAAHQAAHPAKGLGLNSRNGIVDVSRYLGRRSSIPVQVGSKMIPMRQAVRRAIARRAKQAKLQRKLKKQGRARAFHAVTQPIGTTRTWVALDDGAGVFYR